MNPMLLADFYKLSHRLMYPEGTEKVLSTWTPRTSRMAGVDKVVVFGHQMFIKKYLINYFNDNFFKQPKHKVVGDYRRIVKNTLGGEVDSKHIEELHDLGYLPIKIKGLAEGSVVPLRTPVMTIENTHPKFFWLTNYIETLASCELWQASTSATIGNEYRKLLDKYAMLTVGNTDFVGFQAHDFSMRGLSSLYSAVSSGLGHLLSFVGTDTIPAIQGAELYYGANVEKELVGTSIPATEHSVQCSYDNDVEYIKTLVTKVHPSGFVSVVSDGYDFWNVVGNIVPSLKSEILARSGGPLGDRVVIRPDSGDPVKIVCGDPEGKTEIERKGAIEALYDTFGGTKTDKGFKLLNPKIGLIYGDSITLDRAQAICQKLMDKGFASINCVFGVGSFSYQYNTRDTFGYALKATAAIIKGKEKQIFKNPKTDDGTKKSQKGSVAVLPGYVTVDGLNINYSPAGNMLDVIFEDGKMIKECTLSEVRAKLIKETYV